MTNNKLGNNKGLESIQGKNHFFIFFKDNQGLRKVFLLYEGKFKLLKGFFLQSNIYNIAWQRLLWVTWVREQKSELYCLQIW